jgi:short-subunit dehydrogenase
MIWFQSTPVWECGDKVVVITGASSGIGKALAQDLADQGAKLVLAARRQTELDALAAELPGETLVVLTDVSKEEDCQRLIEMTIQKFGRIDALVNNAGISQTTRFADEKSLDRYRAMMNVNYFGTLQCTFYALPYIQQSSGMIVAVSSMTGKLGVPTRTGYAASKHAIHGFLDSLRTELINTNVHILLACPGYVATDVRKVASGTDRDQINDAPDLMSAEECAAQIRRAMEEKRREILVVSSPLAKLSPLIRYFAPGYVDKMIIEKQKGGRT